jgi:hypothetical protein
MRVEQNVPGEYTLGYAVSKRGGAFLMRDDQRPYLWRRPIAEAKLYDSIIRAWEVVARCFPSTCETLGVCVKRIVRCSTCDGYDERCEACSGSGREVR